MTYEYQCPECKRTKEVNRGIGCGFDERGPLPPAPAPPECDFCNEPMKRVFSFTLNWPKEQRGH